VELDAMGELARHGWTPDYVAVRRPADLQPPHNGDPLVVVAAARLGRTRLIDNVEVTVG
ncbi:MAG: pantoate--beta-alanine ligase, partial [Burkholderiales bacterium]